MYFEIVKYYPKNKSDLIQLLEKIESSRSLLTSDIITSFPIDLNLNRILYLLMMSDYRPSVSLLRINSIVIIEKSYHDKTYY